MEISNILSSFDLGSFGIDIGMVLAVVRMTGWVKEYLETVEWDDRYARFYWAIPFLCAFAIMCPMRDTLTMAIRDAGVYGAFATAVFRFWRVGVQGK